MSVGALITWPYKAGGRSRRGSPKAGTTVLSVLDSSSSAFFHTYDESVFRTCRLHAAWTCASPPCNPFSIKSCLKLSIHFQSSFPSLPRASIIIYCPHILLIFSLHDCTTSTYIPALSWIFPPTFFEQAHSFFYNKNIHLVTLFFCCQGALPAAAVS